MHFHSTASHPPISLPEPLACARGLIFILGVFGALLLLHELARIAARRGAAGGRIVEAAARGLAALPASAATPWPLLALLVWGVLLQISAGAATGGRAPVVPQVGDIALSAVLQYGMAVLGVAAGLRLAGLGWRALAGAPARLSPRRAVAQGLRGGVMLILPTWLLTLLGGDIVGRLGWPLLPQDQVRWLADPGLGTLALLLVLALSLLLAPVAEEIVFRGMLLPVLARSGTRPVSGAVLVSLLFAALHLHAPGLLPLFGVGMACCAGYMASGNILTPVVMHGVFNLVSLLSFFAAA